MLTPELETIVKAARRVANPDYEAMAAVIWHRMFPGGVPWAELDEMQAEYLDLAKDAFDAA